MSFAPREQYKWDGCHSTYAGFSCALRSWRNEARQKTGLVPVNVYDAVMADSRVGFVPGEDYRVTADSRVGRDSTK